jgi:O-antigen/teichoic acid export membrane protein
MSNLIVQLGTLGWLNLARRMSARFDHDPPELAKGFLLRSFQIPTCAVATAVVALITVSNLDILGADLSQSLFWSALASVPLLFVYICREYLAGMDRPAVSALTSETLPMGIACGLIILTGTTTFHGAVFCVILASCGALATQIPLLTRPFSHILKSECTTFSTKAWSRVASFTLVGYGGKLLMDRMDTLILAPIAGIEQLAFYNSATRIANLLLLVPTILLPVFSPRVSRAFIAGDRKQLRFEIGMQTTIIAVTLLPIASALALFPDQLMAVVFGESYSAAGKILWLVVVAQVIFSFSLPWSNLLMMTDGEVPYAATSAVALTVNLLAASILISIYGVIGAAAATILSVAVMTAMFVFYGWKYIRLGEGIANT